MTKKEWLQERVSVDVHGNSYTLSDTYPLDYRYMTRKESFEKRRYSKKMINQLWKEDFEDKKLMNGELYG